ncbi:efflux RND transporter periplasmic adaptor subunit [Helicobacter trogontum]|uniref:Efflux RND transporter periplasmic adaptor subunit n=1 Tax=Helicobacter trogontum TaxID=50960 RepID=A0A4U8TFK3_9HELI|nr:efflux RND transporter periplasmic adaptor subunit [Helicobacter trogontum]MDY5185883.1 efflux RND transporter periplasmic adaptor subunit [Helicobacter trogontum]TLD98865.1 efflux RND transporter periplasmic adaptor subunit [Helicobacter trogontum]
MRLFIIFFVSIQIMLGAEIYGVFNVAAVRDSNLMMDTSGIVSNIYVDVGTEVKKDDALLSLSNEDRIQNVNMQKAQLEGAKAQYTFAKNQYERFKRSGSAIDKNTLEQNYSNYKNLESTYDNLQYSLKYQSELLRRTTLVAPFDGVIASRNIELGDGVGANQTKLFRLISNEKKIIIQFDSKYLSDVKVGDIYRYRIDGKGVEREAKIYKIYPAVDVNTRKVSAEAIVPDSMQPGLFGDGYIITTR